MGHHHVPVEVDPQALKHSQQLWHNFTQATKFGVIASVIVLGLMAFFLVG